MKIPPVVGNLPEDLKPLRRWVVWRYEQRKGKPTKVPYNAGTGTKAASNDPQTWCNFEEALRAIEHGDYDGVGFMLGDGFTGIDIDKCRNADTGQIEEWATEIIAAIDGYTETSPSGRGVHIIIRGRLPEGRRRQGNLEMYDAGRYFTVTGNVLGERRVVGERQAELEAVHARAFARVRQSPRIQDEERIAALHEPAPKAEVRGPGLILDPGASPPFEKFDALCDAESRFKLSWEHKRADLVDQSASTYDMSLATFAAMAAWTDQEIVNLIVAGRRKHGADLKLREDYYQRTIAKARETAEPQLLDQAIAELVHTPEGTKDLEVTPAGARPQVDTDHTEEPHSIPNGVFGEEGAGEQEEDAKREQRRQMLLNMLSARFKVPIKRIVKYTGEPTQYRLETGLGNVQLGGVAGLINQSKLRVSIADATGRYLPQIDPDNWPATAQALLDASEVVDRGEDATMRGTVSEWLRSYLVEKSIHPTLEEADEGREPFLDGEDVIIFSGDLKRWLQVRQNERITQQRLTADLRAFGAEPEIFKLVNQREETTRSGWRLPTGPWVPPTI